MRKNLSAIFIFLSVIALAGVNAATAQFTIKLPHIKGDKQIKEKSDIKDTTVETDSRQSNSKLIYDNQTPTSVPVFLKNSIYIEAKTTDEYWKMPKQSNYSSWIPQIRFDQFYNEERILNYTVEYFNSDGSPWYSEALESSGRSADRTVLYQSPNLGDALTTKSTAGTGVYSFKITNQDTKEVLYQGKFKVGKFSRSNGRPDEKNKNGFYVEQDWISPFGEIGFHFSGFEIGALPLLADVWLKGSIDSDELEGRVFYKGKQIAATKENGSVNSREDRMADSAPAFVPNTIWKRWRFQWNNFLFDNNGSFNRDEFQNAFFADKNPGDYTVKIYRSGAQIREMNFTVGADGKFVVPAYASQIPLPYHRLVLPVKIIGAAGEKSDANGWKTDAFYGNPLPGFAVQ